ncbi:Phospholipid ABC transporter substrate-binding protein MlaD [hydrothermal vent metagenome]|uniref:Phospholipid ABC transporter substrate-binding protein MlaD n=1 Tax=hydrothermal vent metagenome TaxID=652676 RepID=A0A3B1A087_9ZZZZ
MTSRVTEIWVGIFIVFGFASLLMLAMKVSSISSFTDSGGYVIKAQFEDISGLKVRSPVTMAGVRIGRVSDISFDNVSFEAVVSMEIEKQYNTLPSSGTAANIYTAGLLGEKYVGLVPGSGTADCDDISIDDDGNVVSSDNVDCEVTILVQGSEIKQTQGSLVLEKLIGQFAEKFMSGDDKK